MKTEAQIRERIAELHRHKMAMVKIALRSTEAQIDLMRDEAGIVELNWVLKD